MALVRVPTRTEYNIDEPVLSGGKIFWPVVVRSIGSGSTSERIMNYYEDKDEAIKIVKALRGEEP